MNPPTTPDDAPEVTSAPLPDEAPIDVSEPIVLAPVVEKAPPAVVPRRHDWIAVALLSAIATIFFIEIVAGTQNFYMRDLTRYYYPAKHALREIILNGEFPYWNRLFSAGQPMAANPEHEVFYPLTWLLLLPNYDFAYRFHILIHVYITLIGMYALLRSMRNGVAASFFGALIWGLGGVFLSYINLLPIMFCAAWLPLTALFTRRLMITHRWRDFALAGIFLGVQCLVGEPTTVMQTGLILGMYALHRGWHSARRVKGMIQNVALVGAVSIAGFLVGAAQMLPASDLVGDSARSRPFEFGLVSAWSLPWPKLAEVIYPNILGHISIDRVMWYWGGGLYPNMGSPFIFSIYSGLLMMSLVVAALFIRPRGSVLVLSLTTFSLLLALGSNTPALKFLYDIKVASAIRYPEKFILIAVFALIVFAARLLQDVLDGDDALREAALGFAIAVTLVAGVVVLSRFTPLYDQWFMRLWSMKPGAGTTRMANISYHDWIVALSRGILLCVLLASVRILRRPIWLTAAALFVCFDLGLVMREINPTMPARFFTQKPPVERTLPANRNQYRVFHESDWYGTEMPAKQYFSTGASVYWIVRNGMLPMTPAGAGIATVLERDYDKTALHPTMDIVDCVWDLKRSGRTDWQRPFMAMSNAWYRASYRPFDAERKRAGGNMTRANPIQFIEVEHYPRYYFADQVIPVRDRHDFVEKLKGGTYSDRVAFVQNHKRFVPGRGAVSSWRETANTASIDVTADSASFLVMSVTPHKYWNIEVDGRAVRPVVTNIAYQGIEVPGGRHTVTMRYRNPKVVQGSFVSIGVFTMLSAIALLARKRD
jgi:hypothetical protein